MPADTAFVAPTSPANRSAISNALHLLPGVDGRSADGRRYRDLAMAMADERGGEKALSEVEKTLIRQAAALTVAAERMQAQLIRGEDVDAEQLTRTSNALARALSALRKRSPSKPAGNLHDHLAARGLRTA